MAVGADLLVQVRTRALDQIQSTPRRRRFTLGLGLAVWVIAVALIAQAVHDVQRDSRRNLEQRFELRADLAARFVQTYAQEILLREKAQAAAELSGPRVTRRDFEAVVTGGGYRAAVLTDARGRLLQIVPRKPSLIGEPVAFDYAHLRSALSGTAAVSRVVPAAADGAAIVGSPPPSTRRRAAASSAVASTSTGVRLRPT